LWHIFEKRSTIRSLLKRKPRHIPHGLFLERPGDAPFAEQCPPMLGSPIFGYHGEMEPSADASLRLLPRPRHLAVRWRLRRKRLRHKKLRHKRPSPPRQQPQTPQPDNLLLRLLLLALLLAVINGWATRHVGISWKSFSLINGVLAIFGSLAALLRDGENKALEKTRSHLRRRLLAGLLDWRTLAAMAIVCALAGSFVSSVTVLADGVSGRRAVYVTAEGQGRDDANRQPLANSEAVARTLHLTTPFGRPFYVEVDGYLRHSFDLYPWRGATLRLGRDLRRAPAVLVRIPVESFFHLQGARLRVLLDTETREIAVDPEHAAVFLGTGGSALGERFADWRNELVAADRGPQTIAHALLLWKEPLRAADIPALQPGNKISVELRSRADKIVARASFSVSSKPLQDIKLLVEEGT